MTKYGSLFLLWFVMLCPQLAQAVLEKNDEVINIGILAYRSKADSLKRWQVLETFLHQQIPEYHFKIGVYTYPELEDRVASRQIDFILTNPSNYIKLKQLYHLSYPLASLVKQTKKGEALSAFAGVIFTRSTRSDINRLADVKNQRIAVTKTGSFGGYQMQAYELHRAGVDLPDARHFHITGMPHDNVVHAVLEGKADVGFVRTGVLESLQREQGLDLSRLKIINVQQVESFPFVFSTRLYPEWPFAALPHINSEVANHFAAALLILHDDPVRDVLGIKGFTIPFDYLPVEEVLRTLRFTPFDNAPEFTFTDIWQRYQYYLLILVFLFATVVVLTIRLLHVNRCIRIQKQIIKDEAIKHLTLLSSLNEGVYGVNHEGICIFINPAALKLLGYAREEILGQKVCTIFHGEDFNDKGEHLCPIESVLQNGTSQQFKHDFQHKQGETVYADVSVTALPLPGHDLRGAVVTLKDISLEKEITERNKILVAALEASQTSIMITDEKSNIQWVNYAFEKLTGYSTEEVLSLQPNVLFNTGKQDAQYYQMLWETVLAGKNWQGELINRRKDNSCYHEEMRISPISNEYGDISHFLVAKNDITERKQAEEKIKYLSEHDTLTDLPNRALLIDRLNKALQTAKRNKIKLGLIFLDLDKFKPVNDTFGHAVGDDLLVQVAARIKTCLRESDAVARIGGDEFIILVSDIRKKGNTFLIAEKIRQSLNTPFLCHNHPINISSSMGVALYPKHGETSHELLKHADIAMYHSKEQGRNNVQIFKADMLLSIEQDI